MTERLSSKDFLRLIHDLQHHADAQRKTVKGDDLAAPLNLLRTWQMERLARTYADLLADERFRPACLFFLSDIYAARDFSQRDHDAEQLYELLSRFLPERTLFLLADTIRLNQLTNRLDRALSQVLTEKLGVTESITPEIYAVGYRLCDNYHERQQQIKLAATILKEVGKGARNPLVGAGIRLARKPAERAGWYESYDFLERGYAALKKISDIEALIHIIQERELSALNKIFSGNPHALS